MLFFDIETLDFFDDPAIAALPRAQQLAALRFGVAVTYDDAADLWKEWYWPSLPALWQYMIGHDLCGWNIVAFDLPVIHYNLSRRFKYPAADLDPLGAVVDLFGDIRWATNRWYKLDVVAEANLGRGKIAHGQQAAEWLRSGDMAQWRKAADYCRDDVRLVIDLWRILERGEPLRLPPRPERDEVGELHFAYETTLARIIEMRRPRHFRRDDEANR